MDAEDPRRVRPARPDRRRGWRDGRKSREEGRNWRRLARSAPHRWREAGEP